MERNPLVCGLGHLRNPPVTVNRRPHLVEYPGRHFLEQAGIGPIPLGGRCDHGVTASVGVTLHQEVTEMALDVIAARDVGQPEILAFPNHSKVFVALVSHVSMIPEYRAVILDCEPQP